MPTRPSKKPQESFSVSRRTFLKTVVASTALLKNNPNPSLEEIKAGLAGNLCRCGTCSRIFEAVQRAARQRG